jgi:hypothetical protein
LVLPAILDALNIDFVLDGSKLNQPRPSWGPYEKPAKQTNVLELPPEAFPPRI